MNAEQLLEKLRSGALFAYAHLYGDIADRTARYAAAVCACMMLSIRPEGAARIVL